MRQQLQIDNIFVGTQSKFNQLQIDSHHLPIPIPEPTLLEEHYKPREGVLFIGRWEEGKNPEAYIRVMKESGLLCKVMTSETSVKKFKEAFKQAGITDFDIKADISGEEKVDFIRSSKVFFMPSLRENYPFAFIECVGHMPTVVLDKQDWSTNFDQQYFFVESLQNVATLIKQLYDSTSNYYDTGALDYIKSLDDNIANAWIDFLADFESTSKKSNSNTAQIHGIIDNKITIRYDEFFKNDLARSSVNRNDCVSFFGNRHKYKTVYTDQFTYLSKDSNFMPADSDVQSVGLFEGL
jgi:hypothetical protein